MANQRRIKREYRRSSPAKFLSFCQKVRHSLTDNVNYPESLWSASAGLLQRYFEKVDQFEAAYHLAINGDRNLIRERDKLAEEVVTMLDEIAALLEAASVRNPDALFTTGFSVIQERRAFNRVKLPLVAPSDFTVVNSGERGKAVASASQIAGAYNHEVHINRKDPSAEDEWFHKAIFPDATSMVMENMEAGNAFFRMRHHGPDGPGPWSAIVSTTIS
ncbi:hypothetical protein LPW11_03435 [Geomonas sp. RF6]|uniref:hypothetical protein n=1 Tax=Geomonas sp. RF6 TaxID=2897342 RepID=UPI001E3327E7|nr:hypothetical protein [Geomonas sp. RF6]UFS71252.1 hypothetical protein LPW11_03435 [Geomonas sp. RF6]